MSTKLFIGNIPWTVTEQELQDFFSKAGEVEKVEIVRDRFSNRSKGFAFLFMANEEGAQKAKEMSGQDMGGRAIKVDDPMPPRPRQGGRFSRNNGF